MFRRLRTQFSVFVEEISPGFLGVALPGIRLSVPYKKAETIARADSS
jgi:hypothetical protein